jgi:hypothetical protein
MAVIAGGGTGFPFNAIPGREWTHPRSGYYTDEEGLASIAVGIRNGLCQIFGNSVVIWMSKSTDSCDGRRMQ